MLFVIHIVLGCECQITNNVHIAYTKHVFSVSGFLGGSIYNIWILLPHSCWDPLSETWALAHHGSVYI